MVHKDIELARELPARDPEVFLRQRRCRRQAIGLKISSCEQDPPSASRSRRRGAILVFGIRLAHNWRLLFVFLSGHAKVRFVHLDPQD